MHLTGLRGLARAMIIRAWTSAMARCCSTLTSADAAGDAISPNGFSTIAL